MKCSTPLKQLIKSMIFRVNDSGDTSYLYTIIGELTDDHTT